MLVSIKAGEISVRFRELRVAISTKLRYGFDLILPGVIFSKMDIRINHRVAKTVYRSILIGMSMELACQSGILRQGN